MLRTCSVVSVVALLFAPAVFAATDFVDTSLAPTPIGAVTNNGATAGNWSLEGTKTGNGSGNRLGGAADPQVGTDSTYNVPVFSMGNDTNGGYIDYNYRASPDSGLAGSAMASIDSTFRVRNMNNGGGQTGAPNGTDSGWPILSLGLGPTVGFGGNGVAIMLTATQQQTTDNNYYYKLVEFDEGGSSARNVLWTSPLFNNDASSLGADHQDPNYERAVMSLDNTGHVRLLWNGVPVYDNSVAPLGTTESRAWVGVATAVNPLPGNARGVVWFQNAYLTASSAIPEPATLGLLTLGSLGLLRRRRVA